MKIGILTFHWATNYGAVLQAYALQRYLESKGHKVQIINYKPKLYDNTFWSFIRLRKFQNYSFYKAELKKESSLKLFRKQYLNLTNRVYKCGEIQNVLSIFDVVISGSDQVLNPNFLRNGDNPRVITPSYFLEFPFKGHKIGYAVSFGCIKYPKDDLELATKYIKNFDRIGVRESTGLAIVKSMGRDDAVVVPDPTLLIESGLYSNLADNCNIQTSKPYIYSFFIRNITEHRFLIKKHQNNNNIIWNNDDGNYSLEAWLNKIKNSQFVITDSFHCVMMCLKLHKLFVVITEREGNVGMNDRLYTILEKLGLDNRIIYKGKISTIFDLLNNTVDWSKTDNDLTDYAYQGKAFLSF
ncbi:MAG: polysaccharide pyruvyl transferase family protein [Lachnospiraceae bacterium]|nr:polysaccharide pyruvyl transferase family protein [Lachnospiraceae bacterium]